MCVHTYITYILHTYLYTICKIYVYLYHFNLFCSVSAISAHPITDLEEELQLQAPFTVLDWYVTQDAA